MNEPTPTRPLSAAEAREVDQICDRFEAACKAGERPEVDSYLSSSAEPIRTALMRQLLLLEVEYSGRDQRTCSPDDTALENGASHVPDQALPISPRGAVAARYEMLNEVGHGGIGIVFRGRDRRLRRDLAIKVLRESLQREPEAERRFVEEARVCSQLQHPAIVPVYELGWLSDGRPFFTMKLVEGHTLATLLRARQNPADDLPRFLGVFEQVCQAIAYAHVRGVVHRDLKPANIMVGAFGEVQVMDWGFAKVLAADGEGPADSSAARFHANGASHSGMLMGTPAYMPPEQARGEVRSIDARADVFSLGAILCEMLTGQAPYMGESVDEICTKSAAGDLAATRTRLAQCGADETLIELANRYLSGDRSARPTDASVVASEVSAYRASAQERLRQAEIQRAAAETRAKVERRARRITLALAGALLIGAGIAIWQAVVATRAKHAAESAEQSQREARTLATAKEAEAEASLDFLVGNVIIADRPKDYGGSGPNVTLRDALRASLPYVEKRFTDQPLVEARIRMTLGRSFFYVGEPGTAVGQLEAARRLYAEHGHRSHAEECAVFLADSFDMLARHDEALKLRQEILTARRDSLGPVHRETLMDMVKVAISYRGLNRLEDARVLLEETHALMKTELGSDDRATLFCLHCLGNIYYALGKRDRALQIRKESLTRRETSFGPDDLETLQSMMALANSLYDTGDFDRAAELLKHVVDRQKVLIGAKNPETLISMINLGNCYMALRKYDQELALRLETLELLKAVHGEDHPQTLIGMSQLAIAYSDVHRLDDAIELLRKLVPLQKARHGADAPETLRSMSNLATFLGNRGENEEALKLHREALALRRAKPGMGDEHPDTYWSQSGVVWCLFHLNRDAEALPIIDDCLSRAGKDVPEVPITKMAFFRLRHFEKLRDAAGCQRTAELWERLNRTDGRSCFLAASFRAVTAKVILANDSSPAAKSQADAHAVKAVAWLAKAIGGPNDRASVKKNPDFDTLRDRRDFQKLVSDE